MPSLFYTHLYIYICIHKLYFHSGYSSINCFSRSPALMYPSSISCLKMCLCWQYENNLFARQSLVNCQWTQNQIGNKVHGRRCLSLEPTSWDLRSFMLYNCPMTFKQRDGERNGGREMVLRSRQRQLLSIIVNCLNASGDS